MAFGKGKPKGKGSVSVVDFATGKVETTWMLKGGGSPDMGNVSADGRWLWLSARYDDIVYAIECGGTTSAGLGSIGSSLRLLAAWSGHVH